LASDIGIIGLGAMGKNLALNLMHQDILVSVYSYQSKELTSCIQLQTDFPSISVSESLEDFLLSLSKPKKVLLMVTAGAAVDLVIDDIRALLEEDDIIIDASNSYFEDTQHRKAKLKNDGIHYLGTDGLKDYSSNNTLVSTMMLSSRASVSSDRNMPTWVA
jgi:6-phosphogluconate dehydrogenase